MKLVNVLVDLPLKSFESTYTYIIPEHLINQAAYGKRVLVEFGRRDIEGFVISQPFDQETIGLKPILQVLDLVPLFDQALFDLAEWLSDQYICPLSISLKCMIPPLLNHKRGKWVTPVISREELFNEMKNLGISETEQFLDALYHEENMLKAADAQRLIKPAQLEKLNRQGLVNIDGRYMVSRQSYHNYTYTATIKNQELLQSLKKKAPRQAELIEAILISGGLSAETVHKNYPWSSINSLLNKEYIVLSKDKPQLSPALPVLREEQKTAVYNIEKMMALGEFKECLLHGVTGSGKTEVYLQLIERCIKKGRKAMVLVPEIALTRHLMGSFIGRIEKTIVWHSGMQASKRYQAWQAVKNGEANLVIGTRSAVLAPLGNIGLIIIDEEHENSYKQEENPRYHACEVARKRAEYNRAVIVYGTATPSLETYYRAVNGEMPIVKLNQRIAQVEEAVIHIADRRKLKRVSDCISDLLAEKIKYNLAKNRQCILFLNRRGYAPISLCRQCGEVVTCSSCSVALNYHEDLKMNICHYCNYQEKPYKRCKVCGAGYIDMIGFGTQKVENEIKSLFPRARVSRLDLDVSRVLGAQEQVLSCMENGEIDILIGTQMVAKGLDFPIVSLVGIIDADSMINIPDFRAGERAFQLIVQSAGRGGRGAIPGEVVIQTYNPDHYIIQMAASQNYESFYLQEIANRKLLHYPPFTNILYIVLSAASDLMVKQSLDEVLLQIYELIDAKEESIDILGPAPCPLYKLRGRYRYQLILKCDNMLLLKSIGENIIYKASKKGMRVRVEINPLNMK